MRRDAMGDAGRPCQAVHPVHGNAGVVRSHAAAPFVEQQRAAPAVANGAVDGLLCPRVEHDLGGLSPLPTGVRVPAFLFGYGDEIGELIFSQCLAA
ncbi:hypothetical protein BH20ACT9_BH20ACT9_14920 [soil metagenome]